MSNRRYAFTALTLALTVLSACTSNTPDSPGPGNDRALTVDATDSACTVSKVTAPSGTVSFAVTNKGTKVTEFYLLASDGLRIIGEVENIAPGISRDLVVQAPAGKYFTACKPGMVGEGIRADFTISDSGEAVGPTGDDKELVDKAAADYGSYVKDQTEQLVTKTEEFAQLYKSNKDDQARALYPVARVHWERIETVAESFGDLDPRMDAREADLEPGKEFTGWHRIEKDLWPARAENYTAMTSDERAKMADQLVADTKELYTRTRELTYSAADIANGSRGLLDEVATGKVTGEEEYWSRTDLWDFQANVDGARIAWEGLRPLLQRKNADLDKNIAKEFENLQKLLDSHRDGDGFVSYDKLTEEQVKKLSDAVNSLSEPLSGLTAAIVG